MSVIRLSDNKNQEFSNLETHVILAEQRRALIEDRIKKLEEKFSVLEQDERLSRRLLIGSLITILGGILTTILTILLR
jgi:hypothetical protein